MGVCRGYSRPKLRGLGEVLPTEPFAPSCLLGRGNGGRLGLWPPGKRATSQATTLPVLTLWRQRSKYALFLPSSRKHEQGQPVFASGPLHSLPPLPGILFLRFFAWLAPSHPSGLGEAFPNHLSKAGPLCDFLSYSLCNPSH